MIKSISKKINSKMIFGGLHVVIEDRFLRLNKDNLKFKAFASLNIVTNRYSDRVEIMYYMQSCHKLYEYQRNRLIRALGSDYMILSEEERNHLYSSLNQHHHSF